MIKTYLRVYGASQRLLYLAEACMAGLWLGLLTRPKLQQVDNDFYSDARQYHDDGYNLTGLFGWEKAALAAYFPERGRLWVAGVGGGREALALNRLGFDVDSFECHPELCEEARARLTAQGFPPTVRLAPRDGCPPSEQTYDGLVVGWSAYCLIQGQANRVSFLRQMRAHAVPGAPVLLSFMTRPAGARRFVVSAAVANTIRRPLGRERVEIGDYLVPYFMHYFTQAQLASELNEAGFTLTHYAEQPYGHAIGRAIGIA